MDLDLDVTQTWQGEIVRLDEDEFVSNRIVLDYPDALVDKARAAFDDIALALAHRAFPFESSAGTSTSRWFDIPHCEVNFQPGPVVQVRER